MAPLLRLGPTLLMFGPAAFHWARSQFHLRALGDPVGAAGAMDAATLALSAALAAWFVLDVFMMRWLPDQVFSRKGWARAIWNFFDPVIRAGLATYLYVGEDGVLPTTDAAMLTLELLVFAVNLPAMIWLRRTVGFRT